MGDRKSEAEIPALIKDPIELARREAENALSQFDWAMEEVERWIKQGSPSLKVSMLFTLHRIAMDGIDQFAGNFRPAGVAIKGSNHVPISGTDVARFVEDMLEYVSDNWDKRTAIHLASYVMWRLNWIHPFADGNGRTSRMLSYMVLCGHLRQVLPGTRTIPEQISEDKTQYYSALEKADKKFKEGSIDVTEMERLLENYLANQLVDVHEKATGNALTQDKRVEKTSDQGWVEKIESKPVIVTTFVAIGIALVGWLFFGG